MRGGASATLAGIRLRRGWKPLVGPTLLFALVTGLAIAGLAGADRTRTAVDRSLADTRAWDLLVNPDAGSRSLLDYDDVKADPGVAVATRWDGLPSLPAGPADMAAFESAPVIMVPDSEAGMRALGRPAALEGRLPDPAAGDEVLVDAVWAESHGTRVGDTIDLRILGNDDVRALEATSEVGEVEKLVGDPAFGTPARLRVVGKGRTTDEMLVDEGLEPQAFMASPAFRQRFPDFGRVFWGAFVRLHDPADQDAFMDRIRAQVPEELIVFQTMRSLTPRMQRAASAAAVALLAFGVAAALLGLLLVGQAYWRRLLLDAADNATLAAMGMTRGQRFRASMMRLGVSIVVATALAVAGAWALSWFAPLGAVRSIETRPGLDFDPRLLPAAAVAALVMLAVVAVAAWRAAGIVAAARSWGRSRFAGWLGEAGAPLSLTTGVRFALDPTRRDGPLPTRATIVGAATGIALAMTTLVFTSGLDRVLHDPHLYGANFDLSVTIDAGPNPSASPDDLESRALASALAVPGTAAASVGHLDEVDVDGHHLLGLALGASSRPIRFTIAEGRAPTEVDEVALGATTMRSLGVGIGQHVDLVAPGHRGRARVVGRAVLPGVGRYQGADHTALGEGVVIAPGAAGPARGTMFVRLRPGTDRRDYIARLERELGAHGHPTISGAPRPADVQSLESLRGLPVALAGVLVMVIALAVTHALVVAVRRRRRDLAVLQAIGARRATLRAAGAWQAVTVTLMAALVGIPVGVVAGRWTWMGMAAAFGTVPVAVVPWPAVAAFVVTVVVAAAVVGLVPASLGLRASPAEVLREDG